MNYCIVYGCRNVVPMGIVMCHHCRAYYITKHFTASAAETSAAGANGQPDYSDDSHRGGSVDTAPAADALSDEQRQTAEYMAEVLRTVKRKTKRLINQVPQRFHGELFDLAIQAARAAAKWDYVNQPEPIKEPVKKEPFINPDGTESENLVVVWKKAWLVSDLNAGGDGRTHAP